MGKNFLGLDGLKHFWTKAKTWIAGQITAEVTAKIAEIVANAPEDLDTLKEIADWISSHANDAAVMNAEIKANTEAISGKADKSHTHSKSEITDFPTSLKNPNALTVNGKTYDGSTAVDAGVQTIENGGTGATTALGAFENLANGLPEGAGPLDTEHIIFQNENRKNWGLYTLSTFWEYIKSKISSVLGLTKDNYGGKSAKSSFLDEYTGGTRPTSGNIVPKDASEYGGMRKDVVTSSMTEGGYPGQDGHLLTMFWDNGGRNDSQFFISNDAPLTLKARAKANGTDYGPWKTVAFTTDIENTTTKTFNLSAVSTGTTKYIKLGTFHWSDNISFRCRLAGNCFEDIVNINILNGNTNSASVCGYYSTNNQQTQAIIVKSGDSWNSDIEIYLQVWELTDLNIAVTIDKDYQDRINISESTTAPSGKLETLTFNNANGMFTNNIDAKNLTLRNGTIEDLNTFGNEPLSIGTPSGINLGIDRNSIQARNNGAADVLYLNYYGGGVKIGNGGVTGSKLTIQGNAASSNSYTDANPKLEFKNDDGRQNISLTFTDADAVQAPASLTLNGNQGNEYFIAPNIKATGNFYGNLSGKADTAGTANCSKNMYYQSLDLSALDKTKFYPLVCNSGNNFAEVAICSEIRMGYMDYNQNRIHFDISTQGWSDLSPTLNIREYTCYENNEITIGCIGRGLHNGAWAIWLRGGLHYVCSSRDCELSLHTSDYTFGDETYTVGTNYYGGSNTNVKTWFTPQSTITEGAYSSRQITAPNIKVTNNLTLPTAEVADLSSYGNEPLSIGFPSGTNDGKSLGFDRNSIQARTNGAASYMYLNYYGSMVVVNELNRSDGGLKVKNKLIIPIGAPSSLEDGCIWIE